VTASHLYPDNQLQDSVNKPYALQEHISAFLSVGRILIVMLCLLIASEEKTSYNSEDNVGI
jgi:hypothetical protein